MPCSCHINLVHGRWCFCGADIMRCTMQVLAEQEAWKIAKASGLDLVTILPNFVLGPVLSTRADGTSVGFLKVRTSPMLTILRPLNTVTLKVGI